ncbi:hypothetical protein CHU95_20735 [Niveispirillum lacus]|uniref:Uncharacterized protein n=1 Tax=Niveispirillum lacus TaxID=1981099 RepID=A0A255YQW3_9PROT|nr:hypothetical protein [Niveispirillum lacus]OYQ31571.1 hypothetical protein CHU95_20735 [Niveispirillum lacus]
MRQRFVLCDPSIHDVGGHYLVYAEQVLRAAEKHGFECILVVNSAFNDDGNRQFRIIKAFEYDIWGQRPSEQKPAESGFTVDDRRWLRRRYSKSGLIFAAANNLNSFQHYNTQFPLSALDTLRFKRAVIARRLLTGLEQSEAAETFDPPPPKGPQRRRWEIGRQRRLFRQALAQNGTAAQQLPERDQQYFSNLTNMGIAAESFKKALIRVVEGLALGEEDHIFFPTMAFFEITALSSALRRHRALRRPRYHLLFRRNVYDGYSTFHNGQEWPVHSHRTAFAMMDDIRRTTRLNFYTDTDPLTDQYNRFGTVPFKTLPVPVDPDALAAAPVWQERSTEQGINVAVIHETGSLNSAAFGNQVATNLARMSDLPWLLSVVGDRSVVQERVQVSSKVLLKPSTQTMQDPKSLQTILARNEIAVFADSYSACDERAVNGRVKALEETATPSIVPAGNSLAAELDLKNFSYHQRSFSSGRELSIQHARDIVWRAYEYSGVDRDAPECLSDDRLLLRLHMDAYVSLLLSPGCTHLWITFETDGMGLPGERMGVRVVAGFTDHGGAKHSEDVQLLTVKAGRRDKHSVVISVPPKAGAVWLGFSSLFHNGFHIAKLSCREMAVARWVPATYGGIRFLPGQRMDETTEVVTRAVMRLQGELESFTQILQDAGAVDADQEQPKSAIKIGFLGDARKEKGFHHLPAVMGRLLASRSAEATQIEFLLQVYAPKSAHIDVNMLTSIQLLDRRLRSLPAGMVSIAKGALDVPSYNAILKTVDAVIVPYLRTNYVARSSGIFTEAIAARKPSIIPAGTWMSQIINEHAHEFHNAAVAEEEILAWNVVPPARWAEYASNGQPLTNQEMTHIPRQVKVRRGCTSYTHIPVPAGATHIWLTFNHMQVAINDLTARIVFAFQDKEGFSNEISRTDVIVNGAADTVFSVVLPVASEGRSIWLGFCNAYSDIDFYISKVKIHWLMRKDPIAIQPGAIVYVDDGSDGKICEELTKGLSLLADNYTAYAHSADWLHRKLGDYFTPGRLVEEMLAPENAPATIDGSTVSRFSAREW